jgi:putative ABC transport system permease protein
VTAPLLTNFSFFSGLSASPGQPPVTLPVIGIVVGAALAVAILATLIPAVRAARTPTVRALADAARSPRRHARLTALSARLPVSLLLGLRLAARRPRRTLLSGVTVAITVTTVVTVLIYQASKGQTPPGVTQAAGAPSADPVSQVMAVLTVVLVVLAAVNAIFTAWATVLDSRYPAALSRALGTSPRQVVASLCAAQLTPAVPGAIVGVPAGVGLYAVVSSGGLALPSVARLGIVILVVLAAVTLLAAIPARIGARRPIMGILTSEAA